MREKHGIGRQADVGKMPARLLGLSSDEQESKIPIQIYGRCKRTDTFDCARFSKASAKSLSGSIFGVCQLQICRQQASKKYFGDVLQRGFFSGFGSRSASFFRGVKA